MLDKSDEKFIKTIDRKFVNAKAIRALGEDIEDEFAFLSTKKKELDICEIGLEKEIYAGQISDITERRLGLLDKVEKRIETLSNAINIYNNYHIRDAFLSNNGKRMEETINAINELNAQFEGLFEVRDKLNKQIRKAMKSDKILQKDEKDEITDGKKPNKPICNSFNGQRI